MRAAGPQPAPARGEGLARLFHETYERLAPEHGYETRKDSAVPWQDVPAKNKALMIAVCAHILDLIEPVEPDGDGDSWMWAELDRANATPGEP